MFLTQTFTNIMFEIDILIFDLIHTMCMSDIKHHISNYLFNYKRLGMISKRYLNNFVNCLVFNIFLFSQNNLRHNIIQ